METKIEKKVVMLQLAAPVLMDTAIALQDKSGETALINLIARDLQRFTDETPDMVHPGDAQQIAADIVTDGGRLARVSADEDEIGFGLLLVHLFEGLAAGTEKMNRPGTAEKVA